MSTWYVKNNDTPYDVRATKLEQPLRWTTNCGLRTFSYIGSRLWNLLVQEYPEVPHMEFVQFKPLLRQSQMWRFWNVMYLLRLSVLRDVIIYDLHAWYISDCTFLKPALYIFCTSIYSRIVAYWLMLPVLQTTEINFVVSNLFFVWRISFVDFHTCRQLSMFFSIFLYDI